MPQGLGLSDAVSGFLGEYQAGKRRQEEERQQLLIEALLQNRFDETQANNLFEQKDVLFKRNQPKYISGQRGRIDAVYPEQFGPSQTGPGGTIPRRIDTIREATPEKTPEATFSITTPEGVKISGKESVVLPHYQRYGVKDPTEKSGLIDAKRLDDMAIKAAKSAAGGDIAWLSMSPEQRKQWTDHFKIQISQGNQFPEVPQITETQPARESTYLGGLAGIGSPATEAVTDTSFITPNQGFQQGQQGGQVISLPPELQNDPVILMIVEDYKNGTLSYEDANDLISQQVAKSQGQ